MNDIVKYQNVYNRLICQIQDTQLHLSGGDSLWVVNAYGAPYTVRLLYSVRESLRRKNKLTFFVSLSASAGPSTERRHLHRLWYRHLPCCCHLHLERPRPLGGRRRPATAQAAEGDRLSLADAALSLVQW